MILIITGSCSLSLGIGILLFIYRRINLQLSQYREDWKKDLTNMNKVIT